MLPYFWTPCKWKVWTFFWHSFRPPESEKCDPLQLKSANFLLSFFQTPVTEKCELSFGIFRTIPPANEKCDPCEWIVWTFFGILQVKRMNFLLTFFSDLCKWKVWIFFLAFFRHPAREKCDPLQVKRANFLLSFFQTLATEKCELSFGIFRSPLPPPRKWKVWPLRVKSANFFGIPASEKYELSFDIFFGPMQVKSVNFLLAFFRPPQVKSLTPASEKYELSFGIFQTPASEKCGLASEKYELSFDFFWTPCKWKVWPLRVKSANFFLAFFQTPCKWKVWPLTSEKGELSFGTHYKSKLSQNFSEFLNFPLNSSRVD